MITVFVPQVNHRIEYIFDFMLRDILKVDYKFTTSEAEYHQVSGPKFSYSYKPMDGLHFSAHELLFETGIHYQKITFTKREGAKVFFNVQEGALPFDLFAASFYLVVRYEEYLPHIKDRHNRYKAEESTAGRGEFMDKPVINIWTKELQHILHNHFPELHFPRTPVDIVPSIEVDQAYAFKYVGAGKVAKEILLKLFSFDFARLKKRASVMMGITADPNDTFDRLAQVNKKYNVSPCYYILAGNKSHYDQSVPVNGNIFKALVKKIAADHELGLHPTYHSYHDGEQMSKERALMNTLSGQSLVKNRFHSFKFSIPQSYRELVRIGIREDHSMGYGTQIGFRASTCTPFFFYDLEAEEKTSLKVFPVILTDTAFRKYMHARPSEITSYMRPLLHEVKAVGGHFEFSFHHNSLGNDREWKNWGDSYENILRLTTSK